MSSLQKFHRRTNTISVIAEIWPATIIGQGDSTRGYWLGDIASNKLIVAPKSTNTKVMWGSYNVLRNTISTTNGLANTNTLYAFGSAAHPAAYRCKTLTTGGYNTWYMPAIDELIMMYSNHSATPFSLIDNFTIGLEDYRYTSSTEMNKYAQQALNMSTGELNPAGISKNYSLNISTRAVRRTSI